MGTAWRAAMLASCSRRLTKNTSWPTKRASGRSRTKVANASLISRLVLALRTWICNPTARAAGSRSLNVVSVFKTLAGLTSTATRAAQPLRRQLIGEKIDPRQIAARPIEAGDEAQPDRVFADAEGDRDRRRCRLGCECRSGTSGRNDYCYLPVNQFGCQLRQPLELTLSPAIFDRHVLALDIAGVLEALAECAHTVRKRVRRCTAEEPDHRHGRLLRARRERPRGRRAEQRDEIASDHSITSSARASSVGGIVRPSARAVTRLITKSNLVGCSTGRSAGLAPRRILST